MDQQNFETSLKALQWQEEDMANEPIDEQAIRWLLLSVVMRSSGEWEKAKGYIQQVLAVEKSIIKGALVNDYMGRSHSHLFFSTL
jgi:hypothetical protein